jgi:hypothetical protein
MKEFKIIIEIVTVLIFLFLGILWKSNHWINVFIKYFIILLTIFQIIIVLAEYGYIVNQ